MVFIFLVFTLGYQLLQERYVNRPLIAHLNALGTDEYPVEIYEGGDAVKNPQQGPPPQTVEQASKAAVSRLSSAQAKAIKRQIDLRIKNAGDDKDAAYKAVKSSMPKRFPGTKTKDCPALDVDCYGANIAKNTINSAYLSAKKSMLADLKLKLNRVEGAGKEKASQIKAVIDDTFKNFETQTNRRITNVATGMRYINWAALIYGIIILFKSLMIVFARVFYARASTAPAQKCAEAEEELSAPPETPAKNGPGKMTRARHKYTLTRDDGHQRYYINFRSCGNNVIDRRRIPQPFALIFRRMVAKNYVMCQIDLNADDSVSGCDIIVDPPAEIVIWDLNEQDEILIDMRALIGFSETCRLGRIISLSLGSLIFGKAVYYSVKGPGRIFVRTASAPIAGGDKDINNVMQASSLIAWQRDTTFNVISSLTRSDTFFSGYSIRKFGRQTHLVIYDTSQRRRVSAGQGIFKMARAFLVPF
ncbi:MAG: hypothetical protein R3E13_04650 [Alphaproteobacteria bacterium]